jgi:group I intron endonuclease
MIFITMGKVFIYILIDPQSKQIRYVGKTTDINRRLRRHISERFLHDSYKDRWIRKLIDNNFLPQIEVIDVVSKFDWGYWEKFYISYFKYIGCDLTNGTVGGDEPPTTKGRKHTIESKLKMSNTKRGKPIPWLNNGLKRTEEHKKNISKSCKGRESPNKGKTYTEEFKKRLSDVSTVKKKVRQLDLNGNLIKVWESISSAEKSLQIRHISEVCRNVRNHKTTGGFRWEYEK